MATYAEVVWRGASTYKRSCILRVCQLLYEKVSVSSVIGHVVLTFCEDSLATLLGLAVFFVDGKGYL